MTEPTRGTTHTEWEGDDGEEAEAAFYKATADEDVCPWCYSYGALIRSTVRASLVDDDHAAVPCQDDEEAMHIVPRTLLSEEDAVLGI
jgi:hypothetical protein